MTKRLTKMSLNAETASQLSMCCAAPITRAYDGVICTRCQQWSACVGTNDPSDLFYLASRAARRGDNAKAIEYGDEAARLLLRDPAAPVESELKLSSGQKEMRA